MSYSRYLNHHVYKNAVQEQQKKQNHRIRLTSVMKLHVGLALINPIRIQSRPPKSFGTKA